MFPVWAVWTRGRGAAAWAVALALGLLPQVEAGAPTRAPLPVPRLALEAMGGPMGAPASPGVLGAQLRRELGLTGRSGWAVADLATGEILDAARAEEGFAPASVAKLATALYALEALGPEHRFETRLWAVGPVAGGEVAGDLLLEGGGDPELDSDALSAFPEALRRAGIRRVAGRIRVDASGPVTAPAIDPQQPPDMAYNPAISGLNLNFNRVHFEWRGAREHRMVALGERVAPPVTSVRAEIVPGGPLFTHALSGAEEVWRVAADALRGRGARWLPVRRPEVYAVDVLGRLVAQAGVHVAGASAREVGAPRLLARHLSRPLSQILRDMLRFSTNLTAEAVGAAVAGTRGLAEGTLAQSAALMNAWAAARAGGPPGDPRIAFANHSGLSTESRVTPERLVRLLIAAAKAGGDGARPPGPAGWLMRPKGLAGADGEDLADVTYWAKTGTMDRIRGLAGYLVLPEGRTLAFAIFSNDLARRGPARRGIDRRWMGRAKRFERGLLRVWAERLTDRRRVSR